MIGKQEDSRPPPVNSRRIRQEHRRESEEGTWKPVLPNLAPTQGIHLSTVPRSIPLGGEKQDHHNLLPLLGPFPGLRRPSAE